MAGPLDSECVDGHEHGEDVLVRKMTTSPSRKLTVDTKQRLIGDYIEKASHSEEAQGNGMCISKMHPAQELQTPGMVLSVWGGGYTETDSFAPYFSQKTFNFDGELSRLPHRIGLMSHRGYKPESPNQDDFFVLARAESLLFGVLDGHGPEGHVVAHFAQERLATLLTERLRKDKEAWADCIHGAMQDLCKVVKEEIPGKADTSGCTVTVAMLDQCAGGASSSSGLRLRVAHLGDSIAVAAKRKSKRDPWEVTQLTDIHRPDREDEAVRIAKVGGNVQAGSGTNPSRLITPQGNLAMSRSFGDFQALPYGLSSEPEIGPTLELDSSYEHLLLICSDGVWDVIPPAQAVQIVGKFRPEEAQCAAERLVSKAQLRWQETEDVVDDITAIVVWPSFNVDVDEHEP